MGFVYYSIQIITILSASYFPSLYLSTFSPYSSPPPPSPPPLPPPQFCSVLPPEFPERDATSSVTPARIKYEKLQISYPVPPALRQKHIISMRKY